MIDYYIIIENKIGIYLFNYSMPELRIEKIFHVMSLNFF